MLFYLSRTSTYTGVFIRFKCHHFATLIQHSAHDSFFSLLKNCSTPNHLYQAHGFMLVRGLDHDRLHLSQFIEVCSTLNNLNYAYSVFNYSPKSSIYLYNTMIKALSRNECSSRDAISLYNEAVLSEFSLDSYTFPFALKAVVRLRNVDLGRGIHCHAIRVGLDDNVSVSAALVQMYSSCNGWISSARKVFDESSGRDLISWNAMVAGYVKVGNVDRARNLFDQMPERDVISWTAILSGYAQTKRSSEAIEFFKRMQLEGIQPDEVAISAVLSACAELGALEYGTRIHEYVNTHRIRKTIPLQNALIDMYAKSGNMETALQVYNSMKQKSVVTWTTVISGLALNGYGNEALDMFNHMQKAKMKPNYVTMIAVLSACRHGGLVEIGRAYFNTMYSKYGIEPNIEHYGCMIDLLGRAGYFQEAMELLMKMPFEANAAIWGCILSASRIHNNVVLGEIALQCLMKLEPSNSGNYSILSNMYSAVGRWNESGMTRKVMKDSNVKKIAGWSLVSLNDTAHEFGSADRSHPHSDMIYEVLLQISEHLKISSFIDLEFFDICM